MLFLDRLAARLAPHDWLAVTSLIAVSGGADSVALARGLTELRGTSTAGLVVVHVNHGLRGAESARDEQFVAALASELGLRCEVRRANGRQLRDRGNSLEAAAREQRYRFFREVADAVGARFLFTAHTADDQAETVLQRILRGTGIDGLVGIRTVRPLSPATTIVRPLLSVRRAEVVHFLQALGQAYCWDATNADPRFTRNRIRQQLLPQLAQQYNPQVVEALLRLSELAGDAETIIAADARRLAEQAVNHSSERRMVLHVPRLREQPAALVRQALLLLWREAGWPLQAMSFDKWCALAALAADPLATALTLPGGIRAEKQGEQLVLTRPE